VLIILFDHSESMGLPFRKGSSGQTDTATPTRLDLARKRVLKLLKSREPGEPVHLISFTSPVTGESKFDAGEISALSERLSSLRPSGPKRLVAALTSALLLAKENSTERVVEVVLVTDGVSHKGATKHLDRLGRNITRLTVIAVNSNPDVIRKARKLGFGRHSAMVSKTGAFGSMRSGARKTETKKKSIQSKLMRVRKPRTHEITTDDVESSLPPVPDEKSESLAGAAPDEDSASLMDDTSSDSGDEPEEAGPEPEGADSDIERIDRTMSGDPSASEQRPIRFACSYPSNCFAGRWNSLLFYAYVREMEDFVTEKLEERAEREFAEPAYSRQTSSKAIPRGTTITITPDLPGFEVNPSKIQFAWEEDVHDLDFRIRAGQDQVGERSRGSILVTVGGLVIADLPMSIAILDESEEMPAEPATVERGTTFGRVFASYSRKDSDIVMDCVNAYQALGIEIFFDKESLRDKAGADWWKELEKMIIRSDVFQLYWSKNSADSEWVQKEWQFALELDAIKSQRFIRPLAWSDPFPKLPAQLSRLQVGKLDPSAFPVAADD